MLKEHYIVVDKVWGQEIWLVNCSEYCGKLLLLNRNAEGSYHRHKRKKETFTGIKGDALLTVEGGEYVLSPTSETITVEPGEKHRIVGLTHAVILEISTHHSDDDVERFSESKAGK